MLQYLVKSAARRRLLALVFGREATGSVSELAAAAGVGFASAHRELREMRRYRLVESSMIDGRAVLRAASGPDTAILRQLVTAPHGCAMEPSPDAADTKQRLRALGAPLHSVRRAPERVDLHETLVDGVRLARKDPTVARILPIVIWRHRKELDPARLEELARLARQKHALGFFLALTARLRRSPELEEMSRTMRDHRVTAPQDLFELPRTELDAKLAEERTPEVAREWSFRMNMELSSFRDVFEKFDERRDG